MIQSCIMSGDCEKQEISQKTPYQWVENFPSVFMKWLPFNLKKWRFFVTHNVSKHVMRWNNHGYDIDNTPNSFNVLFSIGLFINLHVLFNMHYYFTFIVAYMLMFCIWYSCALFANKKVNKKLKITEKHWKNKQ